MSSLFNLLYQVVCAAILRLCDFILGLIFTFWAPMGYFWRWGRIKKKIWGLLYKLIILFSEYCSISALLCSFLVGMGSQRLRSLNPTIVLVDLVLGLRLLLVCDKMC